MANKTFIVQYLIKARDNYSVAADKVSAATARMSGQINRARAAAAGMAAQASALRERIRANLPAVSSLTDKLSNLSILHPFDAIGRGAEAAKTRIKELEKRTEALKKTGETIRTAGAMMTAALTLPIAWAGFELKNAARDAVETQSKFGTVFRDVRAQADAAAATLVNSYGLASTQSKQLLSDTGDLLTGFGFTQQSALELSTRVNTLAVDLASFTNYSGGAEGASQALTKALLGEREQLKSLGIAISEDGVKNKIRTMMAKGARFHTLRQAQAEATLAMAVEQSKNAIGDFARTQGDLANQERIASARLQDMKEAFGRELLPIALKVTKAIRGAAEWLMNLSPSAKRTVLVVAALVAVLGPLLLVLGGVIALIPPLMAGFAALSAFGAVAFGPMIAGALALAAVAAVLVRYWDEVKAFFSGIWDGISETAGPTISALVDRFTAAAIAISGLFGADSKAASDLTKFAEIGRLVGTIIGGALDLVIRGLSGIGAIIGQVIAAVTTMDFKQFDLAAIKAEFLGPQAQPMLQTSRVDVGLNVGLAPGLQQLAPATVASNGVRRTDVGALQ